MLVNLGIEGLSLALSILESLLLILLLLMLRRLVLKGILVEHLILALASVKAICEAVIVLKLLQDRCLRVFGPDSLIFDVDLIECTLINKSIVLVVADLTLLASLKLLPGLFLDHRGVSIQVLTLQPDLFKFLREASFLLPLLFLLCLDLAMDFEKTLLTSCFGSHRQSHHVVLLLLPPSIVLGLTASARLLNLGRI